MKLVADAGPLIALAKVGCLELLPLLFDEILIPREVLREVAPPGETRPGAEIASASWANVRRVSSRRRLGLQQLHDIDTGEAAALVLASEDAENSVVLIDERVGLACAIQLGLRVLRSGAILVAAVERGFITHETASACVNTLRDENYLGALAKRDILLLLRATAAKRK